MLRPGHEFRLGVAGTWSDLAVDESDHPNPGAVLELRPVVVRLLQGEPEARRQQSQP